jgi:hypothetical protein
LLGARSLEGMNLRVDPRNKRLIFGSSRITGKEGECLPVGTVGSGPTLQMRVFTDARVDRHGLPLHEFPGIP